MNDLKLSPAILRDQRDEARAEVERLRRELEEANEGPGAPCFCRFDGDGNIIGNECEGHRRLRAAGRELAEAVRQVDAALARLPSGSGTDRIDSIRGILREAVARYRKQVDE